MENQRFDELTRCLQKPVSRRQMSKGLATATALCALFLVPAIPVAASQASAGRALMGRAPASLMPVSRAKSVRVASGTSLFRQAPGRVVRQAHDPARLTRGQTLDPRVSLISRKGPLNVGAAHILPVVRRHAGSMASTISSNSDPGGNLQYGNGSVQHNPTFYAIFWLPQGHYEQVGSDSTYENLMTRYLQDAGSTGEANVVSQYYDVTGKVARNIAPSTQYGGSWVDTNAFPHAGTTSDPLLDPDIQTAVNDALAANPTWQDGINSTFFVFTGWGVESCMDSTHASCTSGIPSSSGYCAYHGHFTDANNHDAVYANMPEDEYWNFTNFFNGEGSCLRTAALPNFDIYADAEFSSLSHEQWEAETDPLNGGGWADSAGNEIGDKCAGQFGYQPYFGPSNTDVNGHLYAVQEEWSNVDGGCSEDYYAPGDGSYYLGYGPYSAQTGSDTGDLQLGRTVLAPNHNCCGTPNASVDWGDGSTSEPGGDHGCIICNLHAGHTYTFDPNITYPKIYTVTVSYWTGINTCPACGLRTDTQRSISFHIIVFQDQFPLIITADPKTMVYGSSPPSFTASISGFVGNDNSSVVTGLTCGATDAHSNPVSDATPVGGYTITCSGASAPPYYLISYVSGTLNITPADLTITASSATILPGRPIPTITPSYSGFVLGQSPSSLTTLPTCGTAATHISPPGFYPTTCSGAVDANYHFIYVPGTLAIEQIASAVGDLTCSPTAILTGIVGGDLIVDGTVCQVAHVHVVRDVIVKNGGSLLGDVVAGRNLQAQGAAQITLTGGDVGQDATIQATTGGPDTFDGVWVGRDFVVQNNAAVADWQIRNDTVMGSAQILNNLGSIDFEANRVTRTTRFQGNLGGVTVLQNHYQTLVCTADVPAATGQCAG
jgi:hypothetical protein